MAKKKLQTYAHLTNHIVDHIFETNNLEAKYPEDYVKDCVVVKDTKTIQLGQNYLHNKFVNSEKSLTIEQLESNYSLATSRYLDSFVQQKQYNNIAEAISYSTSKNIQFSNEGKYCRDKRDEVWERYIELITDIKANTRKILTEEEFVGLLPKLDWNEVNLLK